MDEREGSPAPATYPEHLPVCHCHCLCGVLTLQDLKEGARRNDAQAAQAGMAVKYEQVGVTG